MKKTNGKRSSSAGPVFSVVICFYTFPLITRYQLLSLWRGGGKLLLSPERKENKRERNTTLNHSGT
jgi:hypothetical protein